MVKIKYVGSSGNAYDLNVSGLVSGSRLRTKAANYHTWKYTSSGVARQYGTRVTQWGKDMAEYSATLYVYGSSEKQRDLLRRLHEDFELDLQNNSPGRIWWGEWYLDCFVTSSSTAPIVNAGIAANELVIAAPYPFWIRPALRTFTMQAEQVQSDFLDYSFDYAYDYTPDTAGAVTWATGSPFASEFFLRIYGAASNPQISVNGHVYGVNVSLASGEYLEIDSRAGTVVKVSGANRANVFDYRNKASNLFQKMPGGSITVVWSGDFVFDLTLYQERSEPYWSEA